MKHLLFKHGEKSFYEDMTYQCDHWSSDLFSNYKIDEEGKLRYLHPWSPPAFWGYFDAHDAEVIIKLYYDSMFGVMEKAFGLVE